MSVTGWNMMALKSGQMAGLEMPKEAFARLERFLEGVSVGDGSRYGYRFDKVSQPALVAGVDVLLRDKFLAWENGKDVYAWYSIAQVVHVLGGPEWERWNARMKEVLPAVQVAKGERAGVVGPGARQGGPRGGRLFTPCFCTCRLAVDDRHLPPYGDAVTAAGPP